MRVKADIPKNEISLLDGIGQSNLGKNSGSTTSFPRLPLRCYSEDQVDQSKLLVPNYQGTDIDELITIEDEN